MAPEARRQHLIDVASRIVEQRGPASLSMEAVADAAGVSRALVYNYFDNRTGLLRALWDVVSAIWTVDPMEPVAELTARLDPRELFELRLVENTGWYFDRIEQGGLLYHRLIAEPQLETSVDERRQQLRGHNVRWWADLLVAMGLAADEALTWSSIFNGATEQMWGLLARREASRSVIEEVFLTSARASLDRLLLDAGLAPLTGAARASGLAG
jgi:AcrR family transcriptional regulator